MFAMKKKKRRKKVVLQPNRDHAEVFNVIPSSVDEDCIADENLD